MSTCNEDWCYEDRDDDDEAHPEGANLTGHPLFVTCQTCIQRFNLEPIRQKMRQEQDADFAQRMHFLGPAGYEPCTIPDWPHEGPCAHPLRGRPTYRGNRGPWICLDWYDGPLIEIARVDYPDEDMSLIEVRSFGWVDKEDPMKIHIRLTKEELQKMLQLLDGKPVQNWQDEDETY